MDIRACKMLREFHLNFWRFPDGLDPENICSDFPHPEMLLLGPCQTEKPIKISSSSLRKWILSFPQVYECSRAPNLSPFLYKDTTFQPYLAPPSYTSKVLEGNYNIVLVPKVHEIIKRAWFLKLRSHLDNFSNYNTTLGLCIHEEYLLLIGFDIFETRVFRKQPLYLYEVVRKTRSDGHPKEKPFGRTPTQPLRQIKHLMVDMNKLKYQHEYLMGCIIDNLLSMSHPKTLTLTIPTTFAPSAIEISKKLYGRGDRNCCLGTHGKCWRHFLKHFEVKEEKKGQSDALSSSYPRPGKVKEDGDEKYKSTKLIVVFTWKFNS